MAVPRIISWCWRMESQLKPLTPLTTYLDFPAICWCMASSACFNVNSLVLGGPLGSYSLKGKPLACPRGPVFTVLPGWRHFQHPYSPLYCMLLHTRYRAGRSQVHVKSKALQTNFPLEGDSNSTPDSSSFRALICGLRNVHIAGFFSPSHKPANNIFSRAIRFPYSSSFMI